jgi:ATP-dependent helicase/nuclease subunit A
MTRSQQALIVSGCEGRGRAGSWYEKVRAAVHAAAGNDADDATAVARLGDDLAAAAQGLVKPKPEHAAAAAPDPRLSEPLPTGERRQLPSGRGMEYGVRFHALMERLTAAAPAGREAIERDLGVPGREFTAMWEQAQRVMSAHARFFDARQFRRAVNEISYISASGEVRRIDRLVEREDAVWVLDYKTGEPKADAALLPQYRAQLAEYRDAMRLAYGPDRRVHAAMLFTDGSAVTLED